jgi:hypothetical protein
VIKRLAATVAIASAVASVPAGSARAQDAISDHIGLIGVGFFTSEAPLGIRYWSGPNTGFDLGVGFDSSTENAIMEGGEPSTTSLVSYAFEAGYLRVIRSDSNMITFLRPGVKIAREQMIVPAGNGTPGDQEKDTETRLTASLMIGAELFMTKFGFINLSFGGAVGAALTRVSPAGGGDSRLTIGTAVADVSVVENATLGFHFYF